MYLLNVEVQKQGPDTCDALVTSRITVEIEQSESLSLSLSLSS